MAASLREPEEGTVSYLVDNGLEPEIWNLYVAENSGAKVQIMTFRRNCRSRWTR